MEFGADGGGQTVSYVKFKKRLTTMKLVIGTILLFFETFTLTCFGQYDTTTTNYTKEIKNQDIGFLFVSDSIDISYLNMMAKEDYKRIGETFISHGNNIKREEIFGIIGNNFQRFYIHYTSIKQNSIYPNEYFVTGKTKVYDNICNFQGIIKVNSARTGNFENISNIREGYLTSNIILFEDSSQSFSGQINGTLRTSFFIDSIGKIKYNVLYFGADGLNDNQFEGNWTSYKTNKTLICNWGEYRIPGTYTWGEYKLVGNDTLDAGAAYFIPKKKYLKNGWESYYNAIISFDDNDETKRLWAIENKEWWK